jgi:signal transduction histidine kinase
MSGTNHSTGGFRRITRLDQPASVRFVGFVLVLVLGSALVAWLTRTTWRQLQQLENEHSAVETESLHIGVSLRNSVRSQNEKLLQFAISRDPAVARAFLEESDKLKKWFAASRPVLSQLSDLQLLKKTDAFAQLDILGKAEVTYGQYLTNAAKLLNPASGPSEHSFEEAYAEVRTASDELLKLCDDLVQAQGLAFAVFLAATQDTLASHHRLLKISSALTLAFFLALAILTYRGMIAPLRLRLSQSQLIIERQEKLASLGTLAAGVAHEIRNPLTALKFRLFSLKTSIPAVAANEDAAVIATEISRLERIVKDFLQFARPSEPEPATVPALRLINEVAVLLQPQLQRTAIHLEIRPIDQPSVHVDPHQLKQVLINLIQNSADAIGRDGTITLSLRAATAGLGGRTRPVAVLAVADTGKGIPPEAEKRLFDPFFTTKEGGTGLGLAIAARIVGKHGGLLRYQTQLHRGTTFEILLPVTDDYVATNPPH